MDVGDLGILAAHYGLTAGATWAMGNFNADGQVDVSDLGILAAHYGQSTVATMETEPALGLTVDQSDQGCNSAGLLLMVGMFLMGYQLIKLK